MTVAEASGTVNRPLRWDLSSQTHSGFMIRPEMCGSACRIAGIGAMKVFLKIAFARKIVTAATVWSAADLGSIRQGSPSHLCGIYSTQQDHDTILVSVLYRTFNNGHVVELQPCKVQKPHRDI